MGGGGGCRSTRGRIRGCDAVGTRALGAGQQIQKVLQKLDRILLTRGGELGVAAANDGLEGGRADGRGFGGWSSIILLLVAHHHHLPLRLRLPAGQGHPQLGHVGQQVARHVGGGGRQEGRGCSAAVARAEGGHPPQRLHDAGQVARVAQVGQADGTRAGDGVEGRPRLRDAVKLVGQVQVDLQLRHRFLGLDQPPPVNAPVRQVGGQVGVQHHVVFIGGIGVDVGGVGSDGA